MGEEVRNNTANGNETRSAQVVLKAEHVVMDKGDKHYDFIAYKVVIDDIEVPINVERSASGLLYKLLK